MDEVDRPHVRDGGPVEPGGEQEEPHGQAEGAEDQAAAGPFFTGAGHGGVSLADVANPGTKPTESPTSRPVPTSPERCFLSDCYGEVLNSSAARSHPALPEITPNAIKLTSK